MRELMVIVMVAPVRGEKCRDDMNVTRMLLPVSLHAKRMRETIDTESGMIHE